MDVTTYLTLHGANLQQIRQAVERQVGLDPDEALFVSGSLTSDLGNAHSDLDLFLVTGRDLSKHAAFGQAMPFSLGRLTVDLEFISLVQIESLVASLNACHSSVLRGQERKSLDIPPRELDFLHRIITGQALTNESCFEHLRGRIDTQRLRRVIVARSAVIAASEQQDFVGYLQARDFLSARFAGARMIDAAIDAALAALGNTMVKEKWRMRMAERLALPAWDKDFPGGPLPQPLAATYFALHDWPREAGSIDAHACTMVRFANRCIPWAQGRVYGLGGGIDTRPPTATEPDGDTLPPIASHVILRYRESKLCASSFSRPGVLTLDRHAQDAIACFDGATSPASLANLIAKNASGSHDEARQRADRLAHVLYAAGFLDLSVR